MHDRFDSIAFKAGAKVSRMEKIALKKISPLDELPVTATQIVKDDRLKSSPDKTLVNVRTDIACTTDNENHISLSIESGLGIDSMFHLVGPSPGLWENCLQRP